MEKRKTLEQPLIFLRPLGGFFNTLNFFGVSQKITSANPLHSCQSISEYPRCLLLR